MSDAWSAAEIPPDNEISPAFPDTLIPLDKYKSPVSAKAEAPLVMCTAPLLPELSADNIRTALPSEATPDDEPDATITSPPAALVAEPPNNDTLPPAAPSPPTLVTSPPALI